MISEATKSVVARSKKIYESRLRAELEPDHRGEYVAIEPQSGDYFIAETFDAAVRKARSAHPEKLTHTIRIGHSAAFQIGAAIS